MIILIYILNLLFILSLLLLIIYNYKQNPPPITAPISAEAKDLIMSLLSKDPKRRPASEDILAL